MASHPAAHRASTYRPAETEAPARRRTVHNDNSTALESAAVPLAALSAWQGLVDHGRLEAASAWSSPGLPAVSATSPSSSHATAARNSSIPATGPPISFLTRQAAVRLPLRTASASSRSPRQRAKANLKTTSAMFSTQRLDFRTTRPSEILATNSETVGFQDHSLRRFTCLSG